MVFSQRMWRLIGIGRNALQSGDINESVISGLVRLFRHRANRRQFLFGMEEAFVPSGNVVVDLDSEDMTLLRLANDTRRVVLRMQRPCGDADVMRPVLSGGRSRCEGARCECGH